MLGDGRYPPKGKGEIHIREVVCYQLVTATPSVRDPHSAGRAILMRSEVKLRSEGLNIVVWAVRLLFYALGGLGGTTNELTSGVRV